jgi:uncharacterized protein (DUF2267 family)
MEVERFFREVRDRAGLETREQVENAVRAVFGALRDRISPGGAANVASQLPRELRELWDAGVLHEAARVIGGVDRMDQEEFLRRVQNACHLPDINQAESVTRAVFAVLQEQITPGESHAVEAQLPPDLKEMWAEERPPTVVEARYDSHAIGPAQASLQRSDEQVERSVRELLDANDTIDASRIEVEAHQGRVHLKGHVRTAEEAKRASSVASRALGVVEVENELEAEEE